MICSHALRTEVLITESVPITPSHQTVIALMRFANQYYHIAQPEYFAHNILHIDKPGAIAIYYDDNENIAGFTRLSRHLIQQDNSVMSTYSVNTLYNPNYNPSYAAAKFILTEALKYKLSHPEQELVTIAHANTPSRYVDIKTLNDSAYSTENSLLPTKALSLISALKSAHGWISDKNNPLIITKQPVHREVTKNLLNEDNEHIRYYHLVNPNYHKGNTLLLYIPLNLSNIGQKIKKILGEPRHKKDKPLYYPGF